MEKYYVVREKEHPKSMGFTVRVNAGKLENMTGCDSEMDKICSIGQEDNLIMLSDEYFSEEIDSRTAEKNKENYTNWIFTQGYVADSSPNPGIFMRGCEF